MIYYKCDACQKEISPNETIAIEKFPRRINTYVVGCHGEELSCFNSYRLSKTHLCNSCFKGIANILIAKEEGENEAL